MDNSLVEPRIYTLNDMVHGMDRLVPGVRITRIAEAEGVGGVGLYFMPPGTQTTVFTLEATDDGTADEYYGPCHEFYYILAGEFTMYWGKDALKLQNGTANKLFLKAGDMGYWSVGWKYSAKNTGKVPGTFFWGISRPPKGIERRVVSGVPEWLNKQSR